jgi:hypothetical protein
MKKSNLKNKEKPGLKSSGTSSNIKTGKVSAEQELKRTDASWKDRK